MQMSKTTSNGKKKQHVNICIPKEVVAEILQRVPGQDLLETLKKNQLHGEGEFCEWFHLFLERYARLQGCNPITKEYFKTPPYSYTTYMAPVHHQLVAVGFGFCHLSYEYKLVVLHEDAVEYGETKPFVLTSRASYLWRSLKAIPDTKFISRGQTGAHMKGVLYWYLESCTPKDWPQTIKRLVCFDLTTEEFDMIMVPAEIDDGVQGLQYVITIAEKGGNLCGA
ncbi:hypothetical protein P3L10_029395 [Capsicum annuum]